MNFSFGKSESRGIMMPHGNDVLCGRGKKVNDSLGNKYYRKLVSNLKVAYTLAPKDDKPRFSETILNHIQKLSPSGRFLKQDTKSKLWYDIGKRKTLKKIRQALRDNENGSDEKSNGQVPFDVDKFLVDNDPLADNGAFYRRNQKGTQSLKVVKPEQDNQIDKLHHSLTDVAFERKTSHPDPSPSCDMELNTMGVKPNYLETSGQIDQSNSNMPQEYDPMVFLQQTMRNSFRVSTPGRKEGQSSCNSMSIDSELFKSSNSLTSTKLTSKDIQNFLLESDLMDSISSKPQENEQMEITASNMFESERMGMERMCSISSKSWLKSEQMDSFSSIDSDIFMQGITS